MRLRLAAAFAASFFAACSARPRPLPPAPTAPVGRQPSGTQQTPVNQLLTPHGGYVDLAGLRPQVTALSRDGSRIYVSGKTSELVVLSADDGALLQRVKLPSDKLREPANKPSDRELAPEKDSQVSYTGLCVSPDGRTIWLANVQGSIKVFAVADDGTVTASHSIPLPPANAPGREAEIPAGIAVSPDGARLWVCGNLGNRLLELDAKTGTELRRIDVGVAPYDVVLAGDKLFVSNQGGRRPANGDLTGPAGRGTTVRVDPVRHIASEGSVSVIDLARFHVVTETITGLSCAGLAVSPDGDFVVSANPGSDTLSVLDATTGALVETLWARGKPSDLLTATPSSLCFDEDGERLFVANASMNAIAVLQFEPEDKGDSRVLGYVPVGWYPGALAFDAERERVIAANVKGLPFGRAREGKGNEFNTHQYHGSLSIVPVPSDDELAELTAKVDVNLRAETIEQALLPPRDGVAARAIPERIGEPSRIEHVVYVIKENRTYDQVLGDMKEGNGDPSLCVFGERITPNQHAIARQFVLLDNTYCAGILSADGHQWSTAAFASHYLEKSFAGWPRSYPDGMGENEVDALSYSPAGFLWDHAIARGVTLRNYGEFCMPAVTWRDGRKGEPSFDACFRAWRDKGDDVVFACTASLPSLVPHSRLDTVGWNMAVPDQLRADRFLEDLATWERDGTMPQLVLICLPNDHTNGTSPKWPSPAAYLADNDLAFGRIVEGISKSRFWGSSLVIGIEDDPQNGWDHVSGYRTTCYLASPFCKRGVTVSHQYNTTSVLRTIEQVLGIPPMNVFDASASPMTECFTETPDYTPFTALPSNVPLDEKSPAKTAILDPQLRRDAEVSESLNFREIDRAPEDTLNRILWRAMRGSAEPYPEWAVAPCADDDDDDA
jgi:DNA-binding beta-propeller fold protein YncE